MSGPLSGPDMADGHGGPPKQLATNHDHLIRLLPQNRDAACDGRSQRTSRSYARGAVLPGSYLLHEGVRAVARRSSKTDLMLSVGMPPFSGPH